MFTSSTVRRIGSGVPYADGAEDEILAALRAAEDRSSGSVELAEHITDWPTRYHLSYQRANLLRPLLIPSGTRVLDAGAGSGALARYLAEQGAEVVALEGNPARAEAAALRCEGFDQVEVLCGALDDLDSSERFDIVLLVGVLEYAGATIGGAGGAPAMLRRARSHLRDNGAIVVAIENQLGLKYLLGAYEDHLGRPWVGIDDYPGPPGVRTWTRQALAAILRDAGLEQQRWLAPFPDYKLPQIVLDEQLYAQPDARRLIDQLVLRPVVCLDHPPARLADAAAAHRLFAETGVALEVANSFLVIAAPQTTGQARFVRDDALAWLFGGYRAHPWRRERLLTTDRQVVTFGDAQPRSREWLRQDPGSSRPFYAGRTLGEDALSAVRRHDLEALAAVLERWRSELDARTMGMDDVPPDAHPFLLRDSARVLPDGHLDVGLANFVETDDGLVYIDDEWRTAAPVDRRMAEYRALWAFAHEIVTSGVDHPWGDHATVDEVVEQLVLQAGLTIDESVVAAWRKAEVALQALVSGEDPEILHVHWLAAGSSTRRIDHRVDARQQAELEQLREQVPKLAAELEGLRVERDQLAEERAELAGQRDHLQGVVTALQADVARLRTPSGFVGDVIRRHPRLHDAARRLRRIDR